MGSNRNKMPLKNYITLIWKTLELMCSKVFALLTKVEILIHLTICEARMYI